MQAVAALPQVAGLGAPASAQAVSSRTRIYYGSRVRRRKDLFQRRISSRSSWSSFWVREDLERSSEKFGFGNIVCRAENVEIHGEARKDEQFLGFMDVDSLLQGEVGRIALVATLLLGVGTLAATGNAEAAAVHLRDGLHLSVDTDMRALAMGPEGPLLEEFWDNMRRYGFYFLTVASGGIYSLVKPLLDALRNPLTAVLVIVVVTGTIYLVGLTVSAMLGINEFQYDYAP